MYILLAILLGTSPLFAAIAPDTNHAVGIHPENCPVAIAHFKVIRPCHVERHCLGIFWKNTQSKTITACEFRVYCFDALKRFTEFQTTHMHLRAVASDQIHQSSVFLSHRVGSFEASHICVVPERILFEDNTIWQRTGDSIYRQVVETIQSDMSSDSLRERVSENVHSGRNATGPDAAKDQPDR